MADVAIIILAGIETEADYARMYNGLDAAVSLSESVTDNVRLIFDGAGTKWIPRLEEEDHEFHDRYAQVADIAACEDCARTLGTHDEVSDAEGVTLLRIKDDYTSVLSLVRDDYEVITY
jgi:hypothetical protein